MDPPQIRQLYSNPENKEDHARNETENSRMKQRSSFPGPLVLSKNKQCYWPKPDLVLKSFLGQNKTKNFV